jgi:hypothetical protein
MKSYGKPRPDAAMARNSRSSLPLGEETLLLRACLYSGEEGRRAWDEARPLWERQTYAVKSNVKNGRWPVTSLWPLLLAALRRNGITPDRELLTLLRTAYLREELRAKVYRRICGEALSRLAAAGIPTIVLKGAALAETVYPDPVLRHCHGIDILIRPEHRVPAAGLFSSAGFTATEAADIGPARFQHRSGLPLALHSGLMARSHDSLPVAELWSRSCSQIIAGTSTGVLSPGDNLIHACLQPSLENRRSPRWSCDAWFIIHGFPALDWTLLWDIVRRNHLELPLSGAVRYLAEELRAPFQADFLACLRAAAVW